MHILSANMLAAVRLPEFILEYFRRYAVVLGLTVLVAVYFLVRRLPGRFRSMRSANWPMKQGTVERINVNVFFGQALGELAYSYAVEGERYSGYCLLQFANEEDAWNSLDPLKGQSIWVRYMLGNPALSAVRSADQSFLFGNRHENLIAKLLTHNILDMIGSDFSTWKTRANGLGARNWPVMRAQVEYGKVTQNLDSPTWFFFPNYTAEVGYSYLVGGEYYSGHIERSFLREGSAQKFVEKLNGKSVFVRYNDKSPDISILRRAIS
jgi:hypothetical protein